MDDRDACKMDLIRTEIEHLESIDSRRAGERGRRECARCSLARERRGRSSSAISIVNTPPSLPLAFSSSSFLTNNLDSSSKISSSPSSSSLVICTSIAPSSFSHGSITLANALVTGLVANTFLRNLHRCCPVFFYCWWWCVVLLKRHSRIVRRPGRTCKHVRAPISHPTISEGELGSSVITHASTWGDTY